MIFANGGKERFQQDAGKSKNCRTQNCCNKIEGKKSQPYGHCESYHDMWMPDQIIAGKICCYKKNGVTKALAKNPL